MPGWNPRLQLRVQSFPDNQPQVFTKLKSTLSTEPLPSPCSPPPYQFSSCGKYFPKGPLCVYRSMFMWYPTTVVCRHGDVSCYSDWNSAPMLLHGISTVEYLYFFWFLCLFFNIITLCYFHQHHHQKEKVFFGCCLAASKKTKPKPKKKNCKLYLFFKQSCLLNEPETT